MTLLDKEHKTRSKIHNRQTDKQKQIRTLKQINFSVPPFVNLILHFIAPFTPKFKNYIIPTFLGENNV